VIKRKFWFQIHQRPHYNDYNYDNNNDDDDDNKTISEINGPQFSFLPHSMLNLNDHKLIISVLNFLHSGLMFKCSDPNRNTECGFHSLLCVISLITAEGGANLLHVSEHNILHE
jgi:hypothetical protein